MKAIGVRVITITDLQPAGLEPEDREGCQWSVKGQIVDSRTSERGVTYFKVQHEDESEGWYSNAELIEDPVNRS